MINTVVPTVSAIPTASRSQIGTSRPPVVTANQQETQGRSILPQTGTAIGLSVLSGSVLLAIGLAIAVKKKDEN